MVGAGGKGPMFNDARRLVAVSGVDEKSKNAIYQKERSGRAKGCSDAPGFPMTMPDLIATSI